jgi:hypothetical protein
MRAEHLVAAFVVLVTLAWLAARAATLWGWL